jgi:hypothetical protein
MTLSSSGSSLGSSFAGQANLEAARMESQANPPPDAAKLLDQLATLREENANLRIGLSRRDLIGQANGILMATHQVTAETAFLALVRISQATSIKVHDLAAEIVTIGDIPRDLIAVDGWTPRDLEE